MKLFDHMTTGTISGFGFSAVRPETLGATEYTLVTLVVDKTGSVASFADELLNIKRSVAEACAKSPRADNLLLRVVEFNEQVDEVHGFLPLAQVDPGDYQLPRCGGGTALADATYAAVGATNRYAETLAGSDYLVNAIILVLTDGDDNRSRMTNADVRDEISRGMRGEILESMRIILVGVNAGYYRHRLQAFQTETGIQDYVDVKDASPGEIARLIGFLSRSISAQSVSLGTGNPSQSLTF